jgi:hypothetical protein
MEMSATDDRKSDRERRIAEITGLQREVSKEAWATLSECRSFAKASEVLGYGARYLERLVFLEFRYLLAEGVSYRYLATVLMDREEDAVKSIRGWLPKAEIDDLDDARRKWMSEELLADFQLNGSIDSATIRLKLDQTQARDLLVLGLAQSGMNLTKTSDLVSMSRERVRQILKKKFNFNIRDLNNMRRDQERLATSQLSDQVQTWVISHPGCTYEEISSANRIQEATVVEFLSKPVQHLVLLDPVKFENFDNYAKFTREQVLDALKKAFDLRNPSSSMYSSQIVRPLTGPSYDRFRRNGAVIGPSVPRILQIFGTWRKACEEAGVPSESPVRSDYVRQWTDEDLLNQVSQFLLQSASGANIAFDQWCRSDPSRASFGTVRKQLQLSWSQIKREAILELRKSWKPTDSTNPSTQPAPPALP